jgi:uncharacterized protein (DUF2147 family)
MAATLASIAAAVLFGAAFAQTPGAPPAAPPNYSGLWYDDTGQGAVEIAPCGDRLCGRIVWLKTPVDATGQPLVDDLNPDPARRRQPICGLPVIGDLKRQRNGGWDEGWIYDPKEGKAYDVELRLRSADTLQVTGYLGIKLLSETLIWKRAPDSLKRCDTQARL